MFVLPPTPQKFTFGRSFFFCGVGKFNFRAEIDNRIARQQKSWHNWVVGGFFFTARKWFELNKTLVSDNAKGENVATWHKTVEATQRTNSFLHIFLPPTKVLRSPHGIFICTTFQWINSRQSFYYVTTSSTLHAWIGNGRNEMFRDARLPHFKFILSSGLLKPFESFARNHFQTLKLPADCFSSLQNFGRFLPACCCFSSSPFRTISPQHS